jgi:membrane-associated protein
VTGAQCGYLLGHRAGPVLLQRANRPKLHRGAERANLALARYGLPKAVLLARFVPVVRTVINPLAGALRRPVRTITIRQTVGGLGWTTGIILAGHWLGESIPSIDTYLLPIIALIVIASVAPLLVQTYRTRTQPLQS